MFTIGKVRLLIIFFYALFKERNVLPHEKQFLDVEDFCENFMALPFRLRGTLI